MSVTTTNSGAGSINRISMAWTSDASGNASVPVLVSGTILKVQFVPGTGGAQPSNSYGAVLSDLSGLDVLRGQGASLSNATATQFCPVIPATDGTNTGSVPVVVAEQLTLTISAAGNGKSGAVVLYVR